jgi:hypothetical protein
VNHESVPLGRCPPPLRCSVCWGEPPRRPSAPIHTPGRAGTFSLFRLAGPHGTGTRLLGTRDPALSMPPARRHGRVCRNVLLPSRTKTPACSSRSICRPSLHRHAWRTIRLRSSARTPCTDSFEAAPHPDPLRKPIGRLNTDCCTRRTCKTRISRA